MDTLMNFEIFATISRNAVELIRNENNKIARLSEDKAVKLQRAIRRFSIDQSNIPPISEELPKVNIVVGPSASGKSTLVQSLINTIDGEQIKYIPHLEYSHSVVEDGVCLCKKEEVVIFESILCSKEQRERFMEIKNAGLYVRMFFISTEDPFINVLRGTKQTLLKGKKCDTKKICERYYKSLAAAIALSPYVNELCVFDNSIDNRAPELVLQMDSERTILYRSHNIPDWALLFLNNDNPLYNETTPR